MKYLKGSLIALSNTRVKRKILWRSVVYIHGGVPADKISKLCMLEILHAFWSSADFFQD